MIGCVYRGVGDDRALPLFMRRQGQRCIRASIYRYARMKEGDRIPGLIGWEWHGDPAPIKGLEVVATGPTQDAPGKPNGGIYTATAYPGPKTNIVFNAATCWWADGLAEPPGYIHPKAGPYTHLTLPTNREDLDPGVAGL